MRTARPVLAWLVAHAGPAGMPLALLRLSLLQGSDNGVMVVAPTGVAPASLRMAGFPLACPPATGIFGGFMPLVSTRLIQETGNHAGLLAGGRPA